MPKSPRNASPDVNINRQVRRQRNKADNKGKRRARPSISVRWTAIHRREMIIERLRSIRNSRLQAKASRDLEQFMRDLRLPFLAPSLLDDNLSSERYEYSILINRITETCCLKHTCEISLEVYWRARQHASRASLTPTVIGVFEFPWYIRSATRGSM